MTIRTSSISMGKAMDKSRAIHGTLTLIDFTKEISQISNLLDLPAEVISELEHTPELKISSCGFQELLGHVGSQLIMSLGGSWDRDSFFCTSYGSNSYQWSETKGLTRLPRA